jgi:hypothetical protein
MIYGLFVLVGTVVALFFLFNTGQLSREKTKLVNTSDAVAYSAGVMNARTLNYEAYANRAMLANTVAIAQLVSLASWIKYTSNMANYGSGLSNPKFAPFYPSYYAALYSGAYLQRDLNDSGALENLAKASDKIIRKALMTAQQVAYAGLLPARLLVMNEVAQANYLDDGVVVVDPIPLAGGDFLAFVARYSDDKRTRFAEATKVAAGKDSFVPKRSWSMPALWADCGGAFPRVDWLDRRGGTELIGFDEWKALDTLSEKRWVPSNKTDPFCLAVAEVPSAWGAQTAADTPSVDLNPTHYDFSMLVNPGATGMAMLTSSDAWDYSGLPNFYDLSESALKEDDPRLRYAVRLRRNKSQTLTSEGRSAIKGSGSDTRLGQSLNAYQAQPAGGDDLVAVSASEVFFSREGASEKNVYGQGLGKPREVGSLFNPYWQVRLIQADAEIQTAQALQGAVLP